MLLSDNAAMAEDDEFFKKIPFLNIDTDLNGSERSAKSAASPKTPLGKNDLKDATANLNVDIDPTTGRKRRKPNNSDNSNLPEVRKAILDSTKCRELVCDMLMYLSGIALDFRINTIGAELREAFEKNVPLCSEAAKAVNKKLNTASLFTNKKTYSAEELR